MSSTTPTTTTTTNPPPTDLPIHAFPSPSSFETFLTHHHTTSPGLYLKLAKKASLIPSITASEAVETALCFGWIDGRANAFDANWWLVRFTPRRAKSIWSKKNVATVERLLAEEEGGEGGGGRGRGKMREAGIVAVDAAKKDGRWERAYAGPATMRVPEDFERVIARDGAAAAAAKKFFEGLGKSDRYSVLWRVETASPRSRAQRIEALVGMLAEGKLPGARAEAVVKSKKKNAETKKVIKRKKTAVKKSSVGEQDESALPTPHDDDEEKQPRRSGLRRRIQI